MVNDARGLVVNVLRADATVPSKILSRDSIICASIYILCNISDTGENLV